MKKKMLVALLVGLVVILLAIIITINRNKEKSAVTNEQNGEVTVDDLKNDIGAVGNSEIYTVYQEFDGRKILTVKQDIEYKVALAGVLNPAKPTFENLDSIIETAPKKNGIWVNEESKKAFTNMINELTEGEYNVDNDGYLSIKSGGTNKYDEMITKMINGDKQYFIDVKGSNYIVDPMTGEIEENPFEKMEPEQTYEYYENEDGNKEVVILTTNKAKELTNQEIIDSFLSLFM